MKNPKYISTILNCIYMLIVLLFLLDGLTPLDINNQTIKSVAYIGLLIGTPFISIWNVITLKSKRGKIIGIILPTLMLILMIVIGPITILFSSSSWKTQTILYEHGHLSFKKVEFQMQDVGALGYNRRTVEVLYLTDFFIIINEVTPNIDKKPEWIKIEKETNDLELK